MISGRGLGHTGGTLDKLAAIPGFRTELALDELERALQQVGFVLAGPSADLVPADRKLYALRDATGLVESIPLIASSILSKKLAEGLDGLVLDVKFGSGALLPEIERGADLARTMTRLASDLGLRAVAFQTAMDRPLGRAYGNALEIVETIECLRGSGPEDLRELVTVLGGTMLELAGLVSDSAAGGARIARALDDGSALRAFERCLSAQGGDARVLAHPELLPRTPDVHVVHAERDGVLVWRDVRELGLAVVALGGGRRTIADEVDPAVGVRATRVAAEVVAREEPLFDVHHRAGRGLAEALERLERAYALVPSSCAPPLSPLILGRTHVGRGRA
jgi:pyrimidine-nucleoside phosphorylase